ncbi:BRCT domain-containing protein [Rhodotorula toruloides]|uniref:BRCT domain-containing protein n=1 Tax=Rhodotorula toruloides TaxID=5286 RepID=A0A2T0A8R0_RHOTO|nr:BRCT domain-containing protein [Rhodotorula toruloides]PRQ74410.1 hypothetical protein AAT19DRAFT_14763 [Rhodotorula toruloides]
MASSSSSGPAGASGAPPTLPPPTRSTAVTRSMSRRSLAGPLESSALSSTTTSSARRVQPGDGTSTSAAPPRARSTTSLAQLASTRPTGKVLIPSIHAPGSIRSRRVLGESSNRVPSTSSSALSASTSAAAKPKPRSRRLSTAEAGKMTGMGVVRAGPAVMGHPPRRSTSTPSGLSTSGGTGGIVAGGSNDPFSTAFVRPTFDFEVSGGARKAEVQQPEQPKRVVKPLPSSSSAGTARTVHGRGLATQLGTLVEEKEDAAPVRGPGLNARPFDLTSPRKQRSASPTKPSGLKSRPLPTFDDATASAMDVDPFPIASASTSSNLLPIPASSPVRGPISPRSLTGKTALTRKLDELDSDSDDEDDIDFLSPRKKRDAKRIHLAEPSPVAPRVLDFAVGANAKVSEHVEESQQKRPTLPRSPPPKKRLPVPSGPIASVPSSTRTAPQPSRTLLSSVPMQRTAGRTFGLPNLAAPATSAPMSRTLAARPLTARAEGGVKAAEPAGKPLPTTGISPTSTTSSAAPSLTASTSRLPRPSRPSLALDASVKMDDRQPIASTSFAPRPAVAAPSAPKPATSPDDSIMIDDSSACASADLSTVSATSTTSIRSEETARRLANLQNMLSRLQMPKPAAGPALRRLSDGAVALAGVGEVPLPPPSTGEIGSRTARRASRVPLITPVPSASAPNIHIAPQLPSTSISRRRSSIAPPRAPSSGGNLGDTSALSTASAPASSRPATARRLSVSTTLPTAGASSSFSLGSSAPPAGQRKDKALQGVVAFVDVRTAEGDDSGMIFVDMLKGLGARVTTRPSTLTTHIIFKAGRASTIQFYRSANPSHRPHLVGIAWVVRCAEIGARVDEGPFRVEDAVAPAPGSGKENVDVVAATAQAALGLGKPSTGAASGSHKRRKSMEPKALAQLNNANSSMSAASESALKASIAASIERARRKSLAFAPKVGSPLAKRVYVLPDAPEEDEMDE